MRKVFYLCIFIFNCANIALAQNPCTITASVQKGCKPLPVNFAFGTTNTSPVDSIKWNFGDGLSSTQLNPTHQYDSSGSWTVSATVVFKNGTKCSVTMAKPEIIFGNPVSNFIVNNNLPILFCSRGQAVCFNDRSKPGKNNAPIKYWLWSFGDGSSNTQQNPCHIFPDSGNFLVTLIVTDTNGCQNYLQKKVSVRFTSDLGINAAPKFKIKINFDCAKNIDNILFRNLTDTTGQFITRFIWDFGDGTKDSCNLSKPGCLTKWDSFYHVYNQAGNYTPSLYVENKFGCSNKVQIDTPIFLDTSKNMIQYSPISPSCYMENQDSSVYFTASYDFLARYYIWDFGDPYNRDMGTSSSTEHNYSHPGIYTVEFKRNVNGCILDTIMCKLIKLYGPIAKIMPLKESYQPWDSVPPNGTYLIPNSKKAAYFDTCVGAGNSSAVAPTDPGYSISQYINGRQSIPYFTYTPTLIHNGEPIYDTCRSDTIKKYQPDSLVLCNGKHIANFLISYAPHVRAFKDSVEEIPLKHIWQRGDPIPSGNIYSDSPFVNRPLYMDDTSLFSVRCQAPQKITFTNFSDKFRGYDAVDNFPPGYADKCKNPVYPYASDSMTYTWDFKEGSANYSTKAKPDITARYSSEKLPTHLFQKDGCYWVILTVIDPVTGCIDKDSVPVVLEQPDAGWDPSYHTKDMTWLMQQGLPKNSPRVGAQLIGNPCVHDTEQININQTLPSCFKRAFAMVLDSAAQVMECDGKIAWNWYDTRELELGLNMSFFYLTPGWRTIGLVVTNNYNCSDTVWYHDYIYIHGTYSSIDVSANKICAGDTLTMWPAVPQQPGIRSFVFYYNEQLDRGDTIAKFPNDTIGYQVVSDAISKHDTITSTVQNKLWGIDDSPLNFDSLTERIKKVIKLPGHFIINTVTQSRFGCVDTTRTQVMVGFYDDFSADNNLVCIGDTVHFNGLGQYFVPFTATNDGYDPKLYWNNPYTKAYTIKWDFNGDSIIDGSGPNPYYIFTKPGSYTVTMHITDSFGCTQILVKKAYIKVVDAAAYFRISSIGGDTQYCNGGHFFQFIDSSYIKNDSLHHFKITSWTWDFGDGSVTKPIIDSSLKNASHVYVKNGDYTVRLIVSTSGGCNDTFTRIVHILGPIADFQIIGPDSGCVPFTLIVRDLSKKADSKEWILGDGSTFTPNLTDTIVKLVYKRPGVFCPQLNVTASIKDAQGSLLHCADSFPSIKCALKVTVFDTDRQNLTASDTLVCAGRDIITFKSTPDSGYKTWTIKYGNGDSATSTQPKFFYQYNKVGKYRASIGGAGAMCPDSSFINIRVIDIKADFAVDTAKKDTPVFSFINKSVGGVNYTWNFGDGSPSVNTNSISEISHEFIRAGQSTVCLIAYNEKGCSDSFCQVIKIDTFLMIPNVFTPNGDAYNNHYLITIYGSKYYYLDIFNRWGEKVFHSDDKNNTWDGTDHASGKLYPAGAYYGVFKYRFIGGKTKVLTQGITLIRP